MLTATLAQAGPTTTSAPSPVTSVPLEESIRRACDDPDRPSWLCTTVGDLTGSATAAAVAAWVWMYPLRILFILCVAFVVNRVARYLIKRSLARLLQPSERAQRATRLLRRATPTALLRTSPLNLRMDARVQTLTTVFRSVTSVIIWFVALVTCAQVIGFNVASLLTISSVAGVALGFGAQNVVRDFLAGMFIVLEDQFGVGDTVDIGDDAKGTVEELTLRTTRVRDVNGTLWHVPNGQIKRVANKSQEWARAVLDVEVDGATPYELAARVIQEVADHLSAEEEWMADILAAPEVWGVEAFTDAGFTVRLVLKTRPATQFRIMRELRVRLLDAFTGHGIVLPKDHWARERAQAAAGGEAGINGRGPGGPAPEPAAEPERSPEPARTGRGARPAAPGRSPAASDPDTPTSGGSDEEA